MRRAPLNVLESLTEWGRKGEERSDENGGRSLGLRAPGEADEGGTADTISKKWAG